MKAKTKFIYAFLCLILVFSLVGCSEKTVNISDDSVGKAVFKVNESDIETELSKEDVKTIASFFDGKTMHTEAFGAPSCGFSENVAVIIDGKTYCFAMDDCATVMVGSSYFNLEIEEYARLKAVLKKYGFYFPCI